MADARRGRYLSPMVRHISAQALAERLEAGEKTYLLDVRQPWENEIAALPGSVLIPLNELPERSDEIAVEKDALIVAYCHHGIRSLSAAAILERAGHASVASLDGGIEAWSLVVDQSIPRY